MQTVNALENPKQLKAHAKTSAPLELVRKFRFSRSPLRLLHNQWKKEMLLPPLCVFKVLRKSTELLKSQGALSAQG